MKISVFWYTLQIPRAQQPHMATGQAQGMFITTGSRQDSRVPSFPTGRHCPFPPVNKLTGHSDPGEPAHCSPSPFTEEINLYRSPSSLREQWEPPWEGAA